MKALTGLVQGSDAWVAARARHNCASEAAAMMGVGRHMTRTGLLALKKFGVEKQADYFLARLREKGHEVEAFARGMVEDLLQDDLYPLTATDDAGYLLASSDGLTMDRAVGFECKLWNTDLAEMVRAKELSPAYYWQLEQQCLVFGCKEIVFVCTDGGAENFLSMNYKPAPGRAAELLAGWRQFDEDLQGFELVVDSPKPVAASIERLPALAIRMTGQVIETNLEDYKRVALGFVANINTSLTTDQHFADAETTVKFCKDAEDEIERVKARLLASTASVAEVFNTLDAVHDALRDKRLNLNKQVESQKVSRRAEIRQAGVDALAAHLKALGSRVGRPIPIVAANFDAAMKGKKTLSSLRGAVDDELARVKIVANEIADRIDANLRCGPELIGDFGFLFPDLKELAIKEPGDFAAAIGHRILQHGAREREKAAAPAAVTLTTADVTPFARSAAPGSAGGTVQRLGTYEAGRRIDISDTLMLDWIEDQREADGGGVFTLHAPAGQTLRQWIGAALVAERSAIQAAERA